MHSDNITASDAAAALAPGATISSRVDTSAKTANIELSGATSWDFSAPESSRIETSTSVFPDTVPSIGFFPGTTHVLRQSSSGITGYSFFQIATDLLYRGIGSTGTDESRIAFESGVVLCQLPMTMGSRWTTTKVEILIQDTRYTVIQPLNSAPC